MKHFLILIFGLLSFAVFAQDNWQWTELTSLPQRMSNNVVAYGELNKEKFAYSFGGINDTFAIENIHQDVYKYHVKTNTWESIAQLPDSLPKINFKASYLKDKIYLIGGEYKSNTPSEASNKTHVYNLFLDTFEVDAPSIPIPTHSHVQAVWRDSLLFVIGGINEFGAVNKVQIFNPTYGVWNPSSDLPYDPNFLNFSASGYILEDTIYYYGGADPASPELASNLVRKGIINPEAPNDITWLDPVSAELQNFKGAASGHGKTVFFVGGSIKSYTENGKSLENNQWITPSQHLIEYTPSASPSFQYLETPYKIMDLNGTAKIGGGNWIIAGGIDSLNRYSDKVFLLHNPSLSNIEKAQQPPYFQIIEDGDVYYAITENVGNIIVYDIAGSSHYRSSKKLADLTIPKYLLPTGMLLFVYEDDFNLPVIIKKVRL